MPPPGQKIRKVCPSCERSFDVVPSQAWRICCSRACSNKSKIRKIAKVCPVCHETFSVHPSKAQLVCCSSACSNKRVAAGESAKVGRKANPLVARECPTCGEPFERPAYVQTTYCSHRCAANGRAEDHRVKKTCPVCDTDFVVPLWEAGKNYCSRACFAVTQRGRVSPLRNRVAKTCVRCGDSFEVPKGRASKAKYCSAACDLAYRSDRTNPANKQVDLTCPECGIEFVLTQCKVDDGQRFCSVTCRMTNWRKAGPRNARTMTEVEAAWLAGIFDGEGSIGIAQRQRRGQMLSYRIGIYNTARSMIDKVVAVTGVDNVYLMKRQDPRHLICYAWQVGGRDAIHLLEQMRPWLFARAERADAALAGEWFPRQARWDHLFASDDSAPEPSAR